MIIGDDYLSIISEYYDLSDPNTLENTILCSEADKTMRLEHITNKLYNHIRNNVDKIDFGTIPLSKGDITKIDNYQNLVDCINTMADLIHEYDQPLDLINVISTALNNIQDRKALFGKAFALNIEFPVIMYNTITLAIVSSVHLLIVTCVEYIKNPNDTITTAFDKSAYKKSREHVLFKNLKDYNMMTEKGDMDKFCAAAIKNNMVATKEHYEATGELPETVMIESPSGIVGTLIGSAMNNGSGFGKVITVFGTILLAGITIKLFLEYGLGAIRRLTYYFLETKQNVSDYFAAEADFLQINAENLKYKEKYKDNEEERKKVYNKQMKWVERFRRWSNAFMIADKKAQRDAQKKEEEDNKKEKDGENDDDDNGNDSGNDDGGIF